MNHWTQLTLTCRGRAVKLTGHATLTRLKVMVGLSLLHERFQPTDVDWELSGVASRVSLGMMAACHKAAEAKRKQEAENRGATRADELDATNRNLDAKKAQRMEDMKWDIVRRINTEGPKTYSEIQQKISKGKRGTLRDVLDLMVAEDLVVKDVDTSRYHVLFNGIGAVS